jgi:hypothetical protein
MLHSDLNGGVAKDHWLSVMKKDSLETSKTLQVLAEESLCLGMFSIPTKPVKLLLMLPRALGFPA